MAQWVRVLSAKSKVLSSIPETPHDRPREVIPAGCPDFHMCAVACVQPPHHNKHINLVQNHLEFTP